MIILLLALVFTSVLDAEEACKSISISVQDLDGDSDGTFGVLPLLKGKKVELKGPEKSAPFELLTKSCQVPCGNLFGSALNQICLDLKAKCETDDPKLELKLSIEKSKRAYNGYYPMQFDSFEIAGCLGTEIPETCRGKNGESWESSAPAEVLGEEIEQCALDLRAYTPKGNAKNSPRAASGDKSHKK